MRKIYMILFSICYLLFLSACSMVHWDIPEEENVFSIDSSGGVLHLDDDSIVSGLEINIPQDAYSSSIDFTISTETFDPPMLPDLFNPVTPLIVIDNGHVFSNKILEVKIPIDIDSEVEFAMAFYYDDISDTYEGIPTKHLNDTELVIFTNHFSKIVVSTILYESVKEDILKNPWSYVTGFTPGIDDWQFNNYGSEISPDGHCAGQAIAMIWYYTEKRLKEQQPALYGLFDNETSEFWYDDVNAYKFASVIQTKIEFESDDYLYYFNTITQEDIDRFYYFAYAIKVTQRPQYLAIFTLDSKNEISGGHAISVYKIEYYINEFRLYVADPNFSGDGDRYVAFTLDNGFGVYGSGANAHDLTADNLTIYTEFVYFAESSLIDYKMMQDEYEKMLDGSIGKDVFTTYTYEYLSDDTNGVKTWTPLPESLIYSGINSSTYAQNELVVRTKSKYYDTTVKYFQEYDSLGKPAQVSKDGSAIYTFTLSNDENILGILTESINEEKVDDKIIYTLSYSNFKDFKVTYNSSVDEDLETYLLGQYYEIERGSLTTSPEIEINLYSDTVFYMFERDYIENSKKGDWYVTENPTEDTLTLYSFGAGINDSYIINTSNQTITLTKSENDYIVYQKQEQKTNVHEIKYETSFVEPNFLVSPITSTIFLDYQWTLDMNEPGGKTHQVRFQFAANYYIRIRVTNTSTSEVLYITFSQNPGHVYQNFFYVIADDESIPLTFEIMAYEDGEWTVVDTTSILLSADFTKYD